MPWTIERVVGGGAYATVVRARDGAGTQRALKVLGDDRVSDTVAEGRFRDEARILGTLQHPAIVRAFGVHRYGNRVVMELEWVEGIGLHELLAHPPLSIPVADAVAIVGQVASALWAAWDDPVGDDGQPMRIVHRDIQPANIMLARDGAVKVLDFGVAKGEFADREAMSLYDIGGALGFLAPERQGPGGGPPVDVYAVGALLFFLLGERLLLPRREQRHTEVARERSEALVLPPEASGLRALLVRMIAHDPFARPGMDEVVDELGRIASALPPANLPALASARVVPVVDAQREQVLARHPRWRQVAFLESREPDVEERLSAREASARLERMIADRAWPTRSAEIRQLRRSTEGRVDGPLLAVLDRARPAWWQVLTRPADAEELEAALLLLGDAPSAATLRRARALVDHADERVSRAARFVVDRGVA